ncbi:uncharacterized protein LOC134672301 [Cydia fagiglandana]|uniref:uncharacterized protein LOC134672301 n=1 Tax=Cydia fagiglandana TaxID=1458189 RepID=UPI002FEE49D0
MATMMKEKPRAKKKSKEKRVTSTEIPEAVPSTSNVPLVEEKIPSAEANIEQVDMPSDQAVIEEDIVEDTDLPCISTHEQSVLSLKESAQKEILKETDQSSVPIAETPKIQGQASIENQISQSQSLDPTQSAYKDVCHSLDIITLKDVPVSDLNIEELENKLKESAYVSQGTDHIQSVEETTENISTGVIGNVAPSAPIFEESMIPETPEELQTVHEVRLEKLQCMPLEVAMHIFGGKEMAEVREMSEREEALAEGGKALRPEHPLVDLLSTYRCSAIKLEQEMEKVAKGYQDEEKSRAALWKVEKKTVSVTQKCGQCERSISYTGTYEHATLLKEKLPAAQLRLEGLLKDVNESYCTYQHQALLAYYQIEEFISETVQGNVGDIREALTLVLQELRASSSITCLKMEYFTDSLKRWARGLCGALLAKSDVRQLLFLLHQLFRQTHSVRWAAPLIRLPMCDTSDAARALAILDLMLSAPVLETAKECTEENEEMWEEVDRHGGAGAVSEGALREQDLLALLKAFPLRALAARLALLQRTDITQTRPYEWDHVARDVLRACCGVRALLAVLARAVRTRAPYPRLRAELRALGHHAMWAVADLHKHNRDSYPKELSNQIEAELEAIFTAGWLLETTEPSGCEAPPATLLRPTVRQAYCVALMTHVHEKQPLVIDCLSLSLSLSCGQCVHVASQVASCEESAEIPAMVVDFLVQVALKPKRRCNGACIDAARECLPKLLSRHEYLYTRAVHSIAYVHQLEPLQPTAAILKPFCLQQWRPSTGEISAVLDDWSQRSPQLLPCLLQELSYTPYDGLSLESQLTIGSWLCGLPSPAPDWAWNVLVRLRVHRSCWRLPLDAPPPEHTQNVFAEAYAVLSSSWGHSLPLICEYGAPALVRVAGARAPVAAHALPLVMAAMMHSPASVSLTPQFSSLTSTLLAPPQSLVQWARGEKAATPDILLRRMLAHVENQPSPAAREAAVSTWLQALCHTGLSGAPLAAADALLLTTPNYNIQEALNPEVISHLVYNAAHAPLTCASALLAAHAHHELPILFPRLLQLLAEQRAHGQKIHVDNALKGAALDETYRVISHLVYNAAHAPLTCASALLASHAHHELPILFSRLLQLLTEQRAHGQKIHVDNALKVGIQGAALDVTYRVAVSEVISHLVYNAAHAPLTCASALLASHAHHELPILFPRLLQLLAEQRAHGQKIHVDNALKQIGCGITSDELVIHQTAAALLAPAGYPSLPLWRLLMHLYLHSSNISSDPAPVGPLFFSGLVKSRTLAQLKKRLHETILYHHNQFEIFKTLLNRPKPKDKESKSKSSSPETLLPTTCIGDLTGSESETDSEVDDVSESEERRRVNVNMLAYHEGAEKMLREYSCWLEAGDRLRATPHHADIARFIPAAALNTAWAEHLNSIRPARSNEDDDLRAPRRPASPEPPLTPLQSAVQRIFRIKDLSEKRAKVLQITSPVGDVDFDHPRQLYMLVDKHLAAVETFARQWSSDVNRVATLDTKLWPLVSSLRYRKTLPSVRKTCPNKCGVVVLELQWCSDVNRVATLDVKLWPLVSSLRYRKTLPSVRKTCPKKCGVVVLELQGRCEWPISENATRGLTENRSSAKSALRELLRARPNEAKTVAALNTIARRINTRETAVNVAQRVWACAGAVADCCAAHEALTAVLELLADRWICSDPGALTALVPQWCAHASSPAQRALCRALLGRAGAGAGAGAGGPTLYAALLRALCGARPCEPQRAFSYLSKFDLTRSVEESARSEMLEAVMSAAQRWGREPDPDLHVLLELIGVHIINLTTAAQLPTVTLNAARAAAAGHLPPMSLGHVARAAVVAKHVPFDKLGHLLRELGVLWWRARADLQTSSATYHASHAEHVAALQHALQRAFVAQGVALSYAPERVAVYAWSALQESWSAWVSPHPSLPPLLSGEPYATMLKHFVDNIHQCMLDCPGCEEHLLSQVWEWTIQVYLNVTSAPAAARDSRVQLSELLAQLGKLPWSEHQWPGANCLPAALQISTSTDLEIQTWLADTFRGVEASTWLRGAQDCDIAPRLAALLQLFAGPLRLRTETLEQAVHLPWQRLPEVALDQALQRFFVDHHNPQHPYHDTPQFRVILAGSGLEPACSCARSRRACAVSQWTRAASAPALAGHVGSQARELLLLLAAQEPYVEEGSDELEELLSRAVVIMCMEPAAAEALPVWVKWVAGATPRMLRAMLSAARALTTLDYFGSIADAAAAAFMTAGGTWHEISARWRGCAWAEPGPLLQRGRLHAAYALAHTSPFSPNDLASVANFATKELIISVWICALCRAALSSGADTDAARTQLSRWAEPPRMALLRVLSNADEPTNKHRLLCRLALCLITPNSDPGNLLRAQEACPAVSQADLMSWAKTPSIKHMAKCAAALFPGHDNYFAEELRLADDL